MAEVMTKTQAREWLKRCREGVREAEDALRRGDGIDLLNCVMDISGSACEIETALVDSYIGAGIRGVSDPND